MSPSGSQSARKARYNLFFTGIPNKQDRWCLSQAEVGRELSVWLEELPEGGKVEVYKVRRVADSDGGPA